MNEEDSKKIRKKNHKSIKKIKKEKRIVQKKEAKKKKIEQWTKGKKVCRFFLKLLLLVLFLGILAGVTAYLLLYFNIINISGGSQIMYSFVNNKNYNHSNNSIIALEKNFTDISIIDEEVSNFCRT